MIQPSDTATTAVRVTIDGQELEVPAGTTIWQAAKDAGIEIPVLCHSEKLDPVGVCRMCVVDVGERVLAASCVRECQDGMTVESASPKVRQHRKVLIELLLDEHPTPCEREQTTGDCELEALGRKYGVPNAECGVECGIGDRTFPPPPPPPFPTRHFLARHRRRPFGVHSLRPLRARLRRHSVERRHWPQ